MNNHYYISDKGEITNNIVLGKPYISINCGSNLEFNPGKVRKILSRGTSYSIDLIEGSVAEIHHNRNIFFKRVGKTIENTPSEMSLGDFLCLIK